MRHLFTLIEQVIKKKTKFDNLTTLATKFYGF